MDGNQLPQQPQESQQPGSWQFVSNEATSTASSLAPQQSVPAAAEASVTWTASEFIAHHKTPGWFGVLAVGSVIGAVIAWLITKDVITALSIVGAAALLAAYAGRQPRELTYRIDRSGLHVGPRFYRFDDFRSFAVMAEGAFANIAFTPLKRFAPMLTVYFDPNDEAQIVDVLSNYLPLQPRKADPIDRLMWRIRF